ncbi:MAG: hypothetical protein FJX60_22445 [Alphaproteobacteria bacterium]|nr:hypothetical protein [Alphaproteobacteria bacterium]
MHASMNDAVARIAARYATEGVDIVAGGAGDNTEVDRAYVDRRGFASLKAVIAYTATLQAGETLKIAANLQDDADGAGVGTDFGDALASATVATGPGGGGTRTGVIELDFDLSGANRYTRLQFTPNLSASGTDVAELSAVYILAGATDDPVTASVV